MTRRSKDPDEDFIEEDNNNVTIIRKKKESTGSPIPKNRESARFLSK